MEEHVRDKIDQLIEDFSNGSIYDLFDKITDTLHDNDICMDRVWDFI